MKGALSHRGADTQDLLEAAAVRHLRENEMTFAGAVPLLLLSLLSLSQSDAARQNTYSVTLEESGCAPTRPNPPRAVQLSICGNC
jgi:hypothetical protein